VALDQSADGAEQIVGFLLGAIDRAAFRSELLTRHKLALGCRGALALITRPSLLRRFLRTRLSPYVARLLSRGDRTPPSRPEPERIIADLTAIAVDERARRSGAGRRLVDVFLDRCAAAGVPCVELVTATASPGAVAFYTATGWTPLREAVTRDGVHVQRFGREPDVPEGAGG
jgi:ribosomal protein S18 acetylase RimI-like enzyme